MNPIEMNPAEQQSGAAMIQEYVEIAKRGKWLILGCVALVMALAWGYCIIAPKYYRSEALILAEEPKMLQNVVQGIVEGNLEQRIFIIQRQIANREFMREIAREFELYPEGLEEKEERIALQKLIGAIGVEMLKPKDTGNFSGMRGVDAFTVSFMHEDPGTAMEVTERIAEKFLEMNTKEREKDAEGAAEFFDDELRTMKLALEAKEDQLSEFKKAHIGELPQQTEANLRALDRLELEINSVNENIQRRSDRLAMLDKAMQEYHMYGRQNPNFKTSSMEPDPLFHRLKELRAILVKLEAEFLPEYPEIVLTKQEIRQVEAKLVELYGPDAIKADKTPLAPYAQDLMKLQGEEKSELSLLKQRLEVALASKRDHERRVAKFPEVEQELQILERDYINMKTNYAMMLDKRLHARVTENMEKRQKGGKFRIIDHAFLPRSPVIPNRPRVLVLGFLFGSVLGVGISVMRERLTPQFRGPEDIELLIGPRFLAAIPDFSFLWNPTKGRRAFSSAYLSGQLLGGAESSDYEITTGNGYGLERRFVTKIFPRSMAAEQYRVAAARLQLIHAGSGPSVAVVTSAIKGEGKTTTVINLGYTLARDFGKRVLLVDCDFIYPELKRFLDKPTQYGLVDYLRGDVSLDDAITSIAEIPCWIMPAGESEADPTELLKTDQLERVFSQLREKFDYILLNAPPILPVATMNVLERHVDFLLLVVRANVTSQPVVKRALSSLRGSKPVHVILNGVPTQSLPYYMTDYALLESRERV